MTKYLLDTNICIFFLKGLFELDEKIKEVGLENCFISEVTVAELKFGAEKSQKVERNRLVVSTFISQMNILPIFNSLDFYAQEKNRLQRQGTPIDEFDLLIGATALANDLVLVTNNTKHFKRLTDIQIEDWTQKA